jgi:hypothetical protein
MPEAQFKAVEMVRRVRNAHYARLKGLSPKEKIMFFREKANAFHAELGRPEELLLNPAPAPNAQGHAGEGAERLNHDS